MTPRNQIPPLGPQKRAANLFFRMTDAPRQVCMSAGMDVAGNADGVARIFRISPGGLAPDAIHSILQVAAKFMHF